MAWVFRHICEFPYLEANHVCTGFDGYDGTTDKLVVAFLLVRTPTTVLVSRYDSRVICLADDGYLRRHLDDLDVHDSTGT